MQQLTILVQQVFICLAMLSVFKFGFIMLQNLVATIIELTYYHLRMAASISENIWLKLYYLLPIILFFFLFIQYTSRKFQLFQKSIKSFHNLGKSSLQPLIVPHILLEKFFIFFFYHIFYFLNTVRVVFFNLSYPWLLLRIFNVLFVLIILLQSFWFH